MFGSTETTFYVLAVYFGSVGIKKSRHALVAGLFADFVGIISAVFFCQFFFGDNLKTTISHQPNIVNIQKMDRSIFIDLRYSSKNNFIGEDIYGELDSCYLRKQPAEMLLKAHEFLKKSHPNLRFLVYDGLRPRDVQQNYGTHLTQFQKVNVDSLLQTL